LSFCQDIPRSSLESIHVFFRPGFMVDHQLKEGKEAEVGQICQDVVYYRLTSFARSQFSICLDYQLPRHANASCSRTTKLEGWSY